MTALVTTTIRPGLLVSLKTSISGNVRYWKTDKAAETSDNGTHVSRWETERRIEDVKEHEAAVKVRSKVRALITGTCAASTFGLLCPEDKAEKLEAAIQEGHALIRDFNAQAKFTIIGLYVISGRIAANDTEAIRAINSELRDLLKTISDGIEKLDVKAIRDAANRARSIGQMLSPSAREAVQDAIEVARKAARRIAKSGEQVAQDVDREALDAVAKARTAFLDLDDEVPTVAVPAEETRAVDLAPVAKVSAPVAETRSVDLVVE